MKSQKIRVIQWKFNHAFNLRARDNFHGLDGNQMKDAFLRGGGELGLIGATPSSSSLCRAS